MHKSRTRTPPQILKLSTVDHFTVTGQIKEKG